MAGDVVLMVVKMASAGYGIYCGITSGCSHSAKDSHLFNLKMINQGFFQAARFQDTSRVFSPSGRLILVANHKCPRPNMVFFGVDVVFSGMGATSYPAGSKRGIEDLYKTGHPIGRR